MMACNNIEAFLVDPVPAYSFIRVHKPYVWIAGHIVLMEAGIQVVNSPRWQHLTYTHKRPAGPEVFY